MILKASERGDAGQLARYLLAMRDNDHVELHDMRGFVADNLPQAFSELDAIAKGTRCKNYLFSASLNPPQSARVSVEDFEKAIADIERKLGLEGQPRAIVFHEKDGRRHAHAIWSRIDAARMRAINLPHYKLRLRDVSRELYRAHGWEMPKGLRDRRERNPLNFTREEWQQARRANLDPKQLKALFQSCWSRSDSGAAFAAALRERGFMLAHGDRRGFVAVDFRGEVYAVARLTGARTKEVTERLGDPAKLPPVDQVRAEFAARMTDRLKSFIRHAELDAGRSRRSAEFKRAEMIGRHRQERELQKQGQERRWIAETKTRAARLPRGISGIWHRLTGEYGRIRELNEHDAWNAHLRDRAERDNLISSQADERQSLQREISRERERQQGELLSLREDVLRYRDRETPDRSLERQHDRDRRQAPRRPDRGRDFE
jgi:hypothetical protein